MQTIIAGLDVGKNSSCFVAWDASHPISNPRKFFEYEAEFICLFPDCQSVQKIVALKPENGRLIVFLEPTGSYSRIWVNNLRDAGIEVHLVPHNLVSSSRLALCNWHDKDDEHDAVVLLVLAQKWLIDPESVQLVRHRDPLIKQLSDLYLDGESCNKVLNQLVNRARQKLHFEAPEFADVNSIPNKKGQPARFWDWIAGGIAPISTAVRYAQRLAQSVGSAAKVGFSKQLISYAKSIVDWQLRRHQIDCQIAEILRQPQFTRYVKIFKQFGAGLDTQAALLIQTFPFEQFLGADGKPIIRVKKRGTKSGKPTKAHISCRKFHSAMGMAPNQRSSGEKRGEFISGSGMCRMALWRLVNIKIETNSPASLRNQFGKKLREFLNREKKHRDEFLDNLLAVLADRTTGEETLKTIKAALLASDNPIAGSIVKGLDEKVLAAKSGSIKQKFHVALIRLARSRCAARLVKLLFKQLVQEFCNGGAPSAQEEITDGLGVPVYLTGKGLAQRLQKTEAWLSNAKKRLGDGFADAVAHLDPDGYRWKWHERKFYYAIAPGASDDGGAIALSVYG